MTDTDTPPRRSLGVMLLDGLLRLSFLTPSPKVTEAGAPPARGEAGRYLLAFGAIVAVAATGLVVFILLRSPADPSSGPGQAAALPGPESSSAAQPPAATVPHTSKPPLPSAPTMRPATDPTTGPAASGLPPAVSSAGGTSPVESGTAATPLTASYKTTVGLLADGVAVTVTNPGTTARAGWTLVMTLPRSSLAVTGVSGATATQNGAVWTFRPTDATAKVAAAGSVKVGFTISGQLLTDASPTGCTIDGNACA